jgi:lipopolysaccharide heptosyltransferase II
MKKLQKANIQKILIIKPRGIGDVVLSTIVLDNLKIQFPNASIDYLTERPSNQFLELLPQINNVIILKKSTLFEKLKTVGEIRKNKYDLVFDFYSNPFTAQLTKLSGAKYRAGFPYRGRKYAYNLFGEEERAKYHSAILHLKFLEIIGLKSDIENIYFGIDNAACEKAEFFFFNNFSESDKIVAVSPSGGWDSKKAPPEKFAEFADAISTELSAKILILWGPEDKSEAELISAKMKTKGILAPPTSIIEMAAFLEKADAVLANDSGPMHIAAAVGTPTLGLFGPTAPEFQGPFGDKNDYVILTDLDCIKCNLLTCPKNKECFRNIDSTTVVNKISRMLADG